jgi:phage tail sheath protein FI
LSYTYDNGAPWLAAAGDTYGRVPEWTGLTYPRSTNAALQGSYGAGNCVNSILFINGQIELFGDRTMLRDSATTTNKLTALHNMSLTNYILTTLAQLGHKYLYSPLDQILFNQVTLEYTTFLNSIQNGRGITTYTLICNTTNNTTATINARSLIVDLSYVPTDAAERIYLNATVTSTGITATVQ